jgi:hypothetical protein
MGSHHCPRLGVSRNTPRMPRITGIGKVTGAVAAVGLTALSLVGCASHTTTTPPSATSRPPSPVVSAAAAPVASPTPCPSDSGWTGQNLSTATPDSAAWLTAAQMPDAVVYDWTAEGQPAAMPFAGDMWNVLYDVGESDFLAWQVENYAGRAGGQSATQTILLYASAAQASCAYQAAAAEAAANQAASRSIQAQYGISPDAVTIETVSGTDDSAWTESWTGPSIPPVTHGPQTDVEYMAQVGTALTFVSFVVPGLDQTIPDATAAQATLSQITQDLSVYTSGS